MREHVGQRFARLYPQWTEAEIEDMFLEWSSVQPHSIEDCYNAAMADEDSWIDYLEKHQEEGAL